MTKRKLTDAEEMTLWDEVARRLSLIDREPPIALEQIDQLLHQLSAGQPHESLEDRIRRANRAPLQQPFAVIQLDEEGDGKCQLEDRPDLRNPFF